MREERTNENRANTTGLIRSEEWVSTLEENHKGSTSGGGLEDRADKVGLRAGVMRVGDRSR